MDNPNVVIMEQDKRIRREIANSNERRRMESINSGFQALRQLLPHQQGEKLSKAAILQQTADNIYALEQEKTQLLSQNCQLKRLLGQQQMEEDDETDSAPKRRLIDTGQRLLLEDDTEELNDVQIKLERERKMRIALEERVRSLEEQLYQTQPRQSDVQKYTPTEECVGINLEAPLEQPSRQTVLTKAAQKQGLDLPSIIQYAIGKSDGSRVEVEEIPRLADMTMDSQGSVDAISVQDPHTGNTRQYVITQVDNTSRQNLETIVEAIRHLEGDHLFSDESGPHEVVKEEIVESCIMDDGGTFVEMTLPNGTIQGGTILTTLPKAAGQSGSGLVQLVQSLPQSTMSVSLPTVPVSLQQVANMSNLHPNYLTSMQQPLPQSVSSLVSSIQLPPVSLPQAPVAELQYETVSLSQAPTPMHIQANSPLPTIANSPLPSMAQMEMGGMGPQIEASRVEYPPQTSPVNLELQSSDSRGELSNSPPQSSPVNLAHPSIEQ